MAGRVTLWVDRDVPDGESVPAQDLWRRVGIALSGARWLVEPVALFPGGLAGLVMPIPTCLAALVARGRLRIGSVRRSRQRSFDPGSHRRQGLLLEDAQARLDLDLASRSQRVEAPDSRANAPSSRAQTHRGSGTMT